jgi:hypothetical protein
MLHDEETLKEDPFAPFKHLLKVFYKFEGSQEIKKEKEEESKSGVSAPGDEILLAVAYTQTLTTFTQLEPSYSNILFLSDTAATAFDTDIDQQFGLAKRVYEETLGLKDVKEFLKRPEGTYRANYGEDDYGDEDDEEKVLEDLNQKMVSKDQPAATQE